MSKKVDEAIEVLESFKNGWDFKDCDVCQNRNEKTLTCDKKKCHNLKAVEKVVSTIEQLRDKLKEQLKYCETDAQGHDMCRLQIKFYKDCLEIIGGKYE